MQAMSMFGAGGIELAMMLLFLGGAGLPLGTPPEKENPVMAHVAPEKCLLYTTWAGMAVPDPSAENQTEQLLAEPEVQQFVAALERAVATGMRQMHSGSGDAREMELVSAAPLWARTLIRRPAAIFVTRLEPKENSLLFEGGLIVQAGDAAAALDRSLLLLFSSDKQQPTEMTIGARTFHKISASPDGVPVDIVWGVAGSYLMIGLGDGVIEGMSDRIRAQKEPTWLTELRDSLPVQRRSTIGYANIKPLVDSFAPLGGPSAEALVATLGLRQIGVLQSVTGLDEVGMVSKSRLTIEGQPRGLWAHIDGEGVMPADMSHIPADALFASCFSLEAVKFWDTVLEAIRDVEPRVAQELEREVEQMEMGLGLNVRGLLGALGNNWSIHAAKADGGFVNAAVVVEVWDHARLLEAQAKLLQTIGPPEARPNPNLFQQTPYAGQTIYHYRGGSAPLPVAPAWCLTEKQLIIGLYPQAVKAVLSRKPGDPSLADSGKLKPLWAAKPAPLSVSYYDSRELFEASYWYVQLWAPMALGEMRRQGAPFDFDAALFPSTRSIGQHLRPSVSSVRRTERGLETETRQTLPVANIGAAAPVAVALLLPAVQASREAARRMQSGNNLKHQALAIQNFHDVFLKIPAAYNTDQDGKPLLSWRVAILPFLEEQALYNEFRQNEPWDSEHNKKLIARMPAAYRAPGSNAAPGKTVYLGIGGKRGLLGAPAKVVEGNLFANGVNMASATDGTSNTILIVEASDALAVEWTKPEAWEPDPKNPLKGLVGLRPKAFLAVYFDGHAELLPGTTSAKNLNALFTRDGGEQIEP